MRLSASVYSGHGAAREDMIDASIPRLRLGLILWLAGMLGVVVITVTVLPRILELAAIPAPLWAVSLASLAQSLL